MLRLTPEWPASICAPGHPLYLPVFQTLRDQVLFKTCRQETLSSLVDDWGGSRHLQGVAWGLLVRNILTVPFAFGLCTLTGCSRTFWNKLGWKTPLTCKMSVHL